MLTVEDASIPFSSIGDHGGGVYKLFSRAALDDATLARVFERVDDVARLEWPAAYPKVGRFRATANARARDARESPRARRAPPEVVDV